MSDEKTTARAKKAAPPRGPAAGQKHASAEDIERGYREGSFTLPPVIHPRTGETVREAKDVTNYIALDREGRDLGHASLDLKECLKLRRATLKFRAGKTRNR